MLQVIRDNPAHNTAQLACDVWPDNPKISQSKQQPNHCADTEGLKLVRSAAGWRRRLENAGYIRVTNPYEGAQRRLTVCYLTLAGEDALKEVGRIAHQRGIDDRHAGCNDLANPYADGSDEYLSWNDGWIEADEDL